MTAEHRNWVGVSCPSCYYLNPLFRDDDVGEDEDIEMSSAITSDQAYGLGLARAEGAPPCSNCGHKEMGKGNVRPCYPPGSIFNAGNIDNL